jgi:hypothetical protein
MNSSIQTPVSGPQDATQPVPADGAPGAAEATTPTSTVGQADNAPPAAEAEEEGGLTEVQREARCYCW